ncbi:MAG: radical SAM protein [Candidatus Falkowbacteria bacterium]
MANFAFLTFYDRVCLGPRLLSSTVKSAGHKSSLIILKEESASSIISHKDKNNINYQYYYNGFLRGSMYDVNPWTENELNLLYTILKKQNPDILCISTRSFWTNLGKPIIEHIRKILPNIIVIAGGWGPSLEPKKYLEYCDYVGFGEGEDMILDIGRAIDERISLKQIKNIIYKNDEKLIKNEVYPPIYNLDNVKFPDFDPEDIYLIENNEILTGKDFHSKKMYDIFVGRGCPMNCTYCMSSKWSMVYKNNYGMEYQKVRLRSPENCIKELQSIKTDNLEFIRMKDEVFPFIPIWVDEFVKLYKEKINLPFFAYLRPEFHSIDMVNKLYDAGLRETGLGIQSGSDEIRKNIYHRMCPNEKVIEFAKFLDKKVISYHCDVISHNPFEKEKDLKNTFDFLNKMPFNDLKVFKLAFFPGAPIDKMLKEKNPVSEKEYIYRWYSILYCMASSNKYMRNISIFIEKHGMFKKIPSVLQILFIQILFKEYSTRRKAKKKYKANFASVFSLAQNKKVHYKNMKTIFITVGKGLISKNILRTKIIEKILMNKNIKIVLFFPNVRNVEVPDYFFEEFKSDRVKIEIVKNKILSFWEKIFNRVFFKLVFSESTKLYLKYHATKRRRANKISYFFSWLIFSILSRIKILKKIYRKIDLTFLTTGEYSKYFEKYRPDLIFSTSIINHFDAEFLKEARQRKLKTIALVRSWDNVDKILFRIEPDLLLVQNEIMKKEIKKHQAFNIEKIKVVGFPQFDIYKDKNIFLSREQYCEKKNFNPDMPILFIGSEGVWSEGDEKIFGKIIKARNNKIIPNCNILIRPYFVTVKQNRYDIFSNEKNVFIDDKFRKSDFFIDNWDPSEEDNIDFTNSLFHSSMMITFASTLALDAACFNKPIIAITYGVRIIDGVDRTHAMYDAEHYKLVIKENAISLVNNEKKLVEKIKFYLKHPGYKTKERKNLIDNLCYKVDGESAERTVKNIINKLRQDN